MMTTRSFSSPTLLCLLLILLLGACVPRVQRTGYMEETINGVRVRTYHIDTPPSINPYRVVESTLYGADQGGDTYLLTTAGPAGIAPDGTVLLSDRGTYRQFSRDGVYLGTIGRSGEGPGEFGPRSNRLLDGDRIHVFDRALMRYTRLSLDNEILDLFRYPADFSVTSSGYAIGTFGPEEERSFLFMMKRRSSNSNTFTFQLFRRNEKLELIDTPVDTSYAFPVVHVSGSSVWPPLVNGWPTTAGASDLPMAWCYDEEFRIEFLDPGDLSRWTVTIPHEALAVTNEIKEDYLKRLYERTGRIEEARRNLNFPSHLPHVEEMQWDTSGRLWVRDYADPTIEVQYYHYNVFDRDGTWLFRQDLSIQPDLITGDGFFMRVEDEEGNPMARLFLWEGDPG